MAQCVHDVTGHGLQHGGSRVGAGVGPDQRSFLFGVHRTSISLVNHREAKEKEVSE